jgi:hypothetical protein
MGLKKQRGETFLVVFLTEKKRTVKIGNFAELKRKLNNFTNRFGNGTAFPIRLLVPRAETEFPFPTNARFPLYKMFYIANLAATIRYFAKLSRRSNKSNASGHIRIHKRRIIDLLG